MLRHLARLWNDTLDFVYPPKCLLCGAPEHAPATALLCTGCLDSLFAAPVAPPFDLARAMYRQGVDLAIDLSLAAWPFSEKIQKLVHAMKYDGKPSLARLLAHGMGARIDRRCFASAAGLILIPVPMHSRRLRERGYNQSALLAKELAKRWGVPAEFRALRRARDTLQQALMPSAEARHRNVEGAFAARSPADIAGKSVLLVDDVVTTGSTANACAQALKTAGAVFVGVVAVARA